MVPLFWFCVYIEETTVHIFIVTTNVLIFKSLSGMHTVQHYEAGRCNDVTRQPRCFEFFKPVQSGRTKVHDVMFVHTEEICGPLSDISREKNI